MLNLNTDSKILLFLAVLLIFNPISFASGDGQDPHSSVRKNSRVVSVDCVDKDSALFQSPRSSQLCRSSEDFRSYRVGFNLE